MYKSFASLLFVVVIAFSGVANAEPPAPKVGVLKFKEVMKKSTAAQDLNARMKKKRDQYQAQIDKQEEKLKKAEQELVQQKNILSKEALAERQKKFIEEINTTRKDVQTKRATLDKAYKKALGQIQDQIQIIVGEVSEKKGLNLVMPKSQLVVFDSEFDITADVVKELNAKLPKTKIEF